MTTLAIEFTMGHIYMSHGVVFARGAVRWRVVW